MKPIPKEAVVEMSAGMPNWIHVYASTHDAAQLAQEELPKYGLYLAPSIEVGRIYHSVHISPLYEVAEVYLYLKELFE